jgi:hypothetical protein
MPLFLRKAGAGVDSGMRTLTILFAATLFMVYAPAAWADDQEHHNYDDQEHHDHDHDSEHHNSYHHKKKHHHHDEDEHHGDEHHDGEHQPQ